MSLRRYDVQAKYALVLALLSVVPLIATMVLTVRNYKSELGQIVYGSKKYVLAHHVCLAGAGIPAAIAAALGWNSAGERRNDKPGRSWTGFFVGGLVVTLCLILLLAFYMLRLERTAAPVMSATVTWVQRGA